eukprot:2737398-Rhodomonas_salina.1
MLGYLGIRSHLLTTVLRDVVERAPEEIVETTLPPLARSQLAPLIARFQSAQQDSLAAPREQPGSTQCMTTAPIFGPSAQTPPISESTLPTVNLPIDGLHGRAMLPQWSSLTPAQWTEQCLCSHLQGPRQRVPGTARQSCTFTVEPVPGPAADVQR